MEQPAEYGPPIDEQEARAFGAIVTQALAPTPPLDPAAIDGFLARSRVGGEVRVVRRNGRVAGGLISLDFGQWFGGRMIKSAAVSAVAVAPEHRGVGLATALMHGLVRELRVPLSVLYPASNALYRGAGYESAGQHFTYQLPTRALARRTTGNDARALEVRELRDTDRAAVEALHRQRAQSENGVFERGEWMWRRLFTPHLTRALGYLAFRGSNLEGYVLFIHKEEPTVRYDLHLLDFVAITAAAHERLVALIAAHGSVAPNVLWRGGPVDPLILGLDDPQIYAIRRRDEWMLRIIDVRGALQSRGYSSAVRTELHLDVRDPIVSENQGRIVLEVGEGRAQVREGGDGSMRVDIGTLAGMFSGHLSPAVLRRLGQLDADDATIARATAIFAGPAPWMPDMF